MGWQVFIRVDERNIPPISFQRYLDAVKYAADMGDIWRDKGTVANSMTVRVHDGLTDQTVETHEYRRVA